MFTDPHGLESDLWVTDGTGGTRRLASALIGSDPRLQAASRPAPRKGFHRGRRGAKPCGRPTGPRQERSLWPIRPSRARSCPSLLCRPAAGSFFLQSSTIAISSSGRRFSTRRDRPRHAAHRRLGLVPFRLCSLRRRAAALAAALRESGLPADDLAEAGPRILGVAVTVTGETVGFGGWEVSGADALLRSVVIGGERRGRRFGRGLVGLLAEAARAHGVRRLWLLTVGAAPFFTRLGFALVDRGHGAAGHRHLAPVHGAVPGECYLFGEGVVERAWHHPPPRPSPSGGGVLSEVRRPSLP